MKKGVNIWLLAEALKTEKSSCFFFKNTGVVIKTSPDSESKFGDISNDWISCSDPTTWEPIDITITG